VTAPAATASADPFAAFGALPAEVNVAHELRARAAEDPERIAVRSLSRDGETAITFTALEARSDAIARGLAAQGTAPGDRVSLFVRPGVELIAITYALFKLGAVPVLIDPGMGRRALLGCIRAIKPRCLIGVAPVHVARRLYRSAFRSVELAVAVGRGPLLGAVRLEELERPATEPLPIEPTPAADEAAILFTSGSTGPPKGVRYSHGNFAAQLHALRALYGLVPGEVDVACFPLFALFDTALGVTSVFPELDPSHPSRCDPARIVAALTEHAASLTFGSPAIWRRVAPWCVEHGVRLPHLKRVLIAGAPVPPALIEQLRSLLPDDGDVHTPYGATEALPVTSLAGSRLEGALRARSEAGAGTCVGREAPGIDLRLIRITDDPIERWSDDLCVPDGELGELCVRGPVVTGSYKFAPDATRAAKIPDGDRVWHRMGDVGYRDAEGWIWFCGRKAHRLETAHGTLMPVPQENVFNTHPGVRRSALVGFGPPGAEEPVLVVEPERLPLTRVRRESLAHSIRRHRADVDARVEPLRVLFKKAFPVDVRHNAKIHRGELKAWAARELR